MVCQDKKPPRYIMILGLQISHHAGAQLIVFPFQTTELMNKFRHPKPVHAMKRQVPVFQAERYASRKNCGLCSDRESAYIASAMEVE